MTINDKKTKILLAEDSPALRKLISFNLQKHNFEVDVANNGLDAIERIKENTPDLIITDVMMPEMDGFTLTRIIKKTEEYKNIPIIILTATASDIKSKIKGIKYGADSYLYKPFSSNMLLRTIDGLMEDRKEKIKIAVKSDKIYLFGFKNEKQYFDEITDLLTELAETAVFLENDMNEWKTFFFKIREVFINNFKEEVDDLKLGFFVDKEKIIVKIQWENETMLEGKDADNIFSFIDRYMDGYKINKNELLVQKKITSPEAVLDQFREEYM